MVPEKLLRQLPKMMEKGSEARCGGAILISVDRATLLRDQLGYTGLNKLVKELSSQVKSVLSDLRVDDFEITRFDGVCLFLILPEAAAEVLKDSAREIFSSLSDRIYDVGEDSVALTLSLSYACFDYRFRNVDEQLMALVHRAEAIDVSGGNNVGEAKPGITAAKASSSSDHMLALLMEALRTNSLRVVFQPLLATSGKAGTESYQMLPRLVADDGRLVVAADFLPMAREAALLPVLDRWMVIHASRLLRGPFVDQRVRLFINQSDALLVEPDRREWLARHFASEPGLAGRLVLEIGLEDGMAHLRSATELIKICRDHDIGVCLSRVDEHSRWMLFEGELEPDYLRMSPDLVQRLKNDRELEKTFMNLAAPARERGVGIIMPMVEDQEAAASIWRTGADFMQGNLIQAPADSISA
jgi:EAL domain-containing protein (putative c-di-GMP-specific phosphodiesterase class I)/GGDEF domain-containing protein